MNKIVLVILIGAALSFVTYGALEPPIEVELAFLGFFTGAEKFDGGFDCICTHPFPDDPNDPGFTSNNCINLADAMNSMEEKYAVDATGNNICT